MYLLDNNKLNFNNRIIVLQFTTSKYTDWIILIICIFNYQPELIGLAIRSLDEVKRSRLKVKKQDNQKLMG